MTVWIRCELQAIGEPLGVYPDDTTETLISGDDACRGNCSISGGIRIGDSLFHSFDRFSLLENSTATFLDDGSTNIFARVFNQTSTLDGNLAVKGIGNANFFLLNPNGIVFGPNASLSVSGSFVATTAESILFSNQQRFSTVDSQIPLLTVTTPVGLQFGVVSHPIINQSRSERGRNIIGQPAGLQVLPTKTILLSGGEIHLESGSITANGGRIFLSSLAAGSEVLLDRDLTPTYSQDTQFEDIVITQQSIIDVSGDAGILSFKGKSILISENPLIINSAVGSLGGSIHLSATEDIVLVDGALSFSAFSDESDRGTNLAIEARRLRLEAGSIISGGTVGKSNGGTITIDATESVELVGSSAFLPSLITTSTEDAGRGGDIEINTKRILLRDGAQIQAIAFDSGAGGDIHIDASERIDLGGSAETFAGTFASGVVASSGVESIPSSSGRGGNLDIKTDTLTLSHGAQIAVNSFGIGDSGDIDIQARSVRLADAAQLTAAASFGDGGNIHVRDAETLLLRRGSTISTQAGAQGESGDGGSISIGADFVVSPIGEDNDIVARARQGRGGNITIDAQGLYGLVERPAIANNGTNDIDASSEFGISGVSTINRITSEADTAPAVVTEQALEVSTEVSQSCSAAGNRFVRTGRSGIPLQPTESSQSQLSFVDLGSASSASKIALSRSPLSTSQNDAAGEAPSLSPSAESPIVEATGWQIDDQQIKLVAREQNALSFEDSAHCAG